jgi:hypothetical protein
MNLRSFSGIGRPLDFGWPSNVAIFLVTITVGVLTAASGIWNGLTPAELSWSAVRTAGSVFLAWAICREIDPDRQWTAFVASAAILLWAIFHTAPPLLPSLWLIMATRMVNRSTGLKPTALDWLGFILLGAWVVHDQFATIVAPAPFQLSLATGAALVLSLAFLPVWLSTATVTSTGDDTGVPLSPRAVRRAQLLVLGIGILLTAFFGWDGFALYSPAWAAVLGASTSLGRRSGEVPAP